MADRIKTFREFWPYYVGEHRMPSCRALHYVGTSGVVALAAVSLATSELRLLIGLPVVGYLFAWIGHFFVEKNRPATFTYPGWSLLADFKMYGYFLTGRMGAEVARLYGSRAPAPDAPLIKSL